MFIQRVLGWQRFQNSVQLLQVILMQIQRQILLLVQNHVVDGSCGILRLASPCMKKGNMRSQEMLMGQ